MASSSPQLLSEPASAPRRKHDIENVDLPDSSSEQLLMESSSQQVIEPPGPATCGRISEKQVAGLPDSSIEASRMASSSYAINIVIDELSADTEKTLLLLSPLSSGPCIYRVPHRMRHSNNRHYTPRVVSIGPIHYHNEKLRENQHLKERYLEEFRRLTGVSLKECYKLILNQESKLRNSYADVIELNSKDFVKMVMVDAAFLIMFLVYNFFSFFSMSDQIFGKPNMFLDIRYDMLLLENQLPFFILEDLYELSKLKKILKRISSVKTDMACLGQKFFESWLTTINARQKSCPNVVHILDLLRSYLIPANWTPKRKKAETTSIPSTKELHQAGVKIQGTKEFNQAGVNIQGRLEENMFDIRFQDGKLEVPPLVINDSSELIFRNLLAFELCHCISGEYIFSNYFEMMRQLTLSPEDTQVLIQNGVIENKLANAQRVSTLFQNIDSGNIIDWDQFLYSDIIKDLNDYYEHDWHKWKATLKEKYFKAPWAICSVSAAVIALVLTIVQTVLTILQVFILNK